MRPIPSILALVALTAVVACSPDRGYPSLTPRPIERAAETAQVPAAPGVAPRDEQLEAQVSDLAKDLDNAARIFDEAAQAAASAITAGAGASPGGEQWIIAQQALARVEAAREPLTRALSTLDRLRIERETAARADTTSLETTWARAQALQQQELDRYRALSARVPSS